MKITKPELFRIALKLILVGTGIVLSPHKYFQFDRTLKNVVMNSESAFWDFLWKAPFGIFPKRLLEALGTKEAPLGGAPQGVAGHGGWSSMELHMALLFALFFM